MRSYSLFVHVVLSFQNQKENHNTDPLVTASDIRRQPSIGSKERTMMRFEANGSLVDMINATSGSLGERTVQAHAGNHTFFGQLGHGSPKVVNQVATDSGNTAVVSPAEFSHALENSVGVSTSASALGADLADISSAWNLLMYTAIVAFAFYYVNSPKAQIRSMTWLMLDNAFSIVFAILLFEVIKDLTYLATMPNKTSFLLGNGVAAVVCVLITQFSYYYIFKYSPGTRIIKLSDGQFRRFPLRTIRMKTFGPSMARFSGFSWITFFAAMQVDMNDVNCSPSNIAHWVPLISFFSGWFLLFIIRFLRLTAITRDGKVDREEDEWEESASRADFAGLGLCLSFLLTQSLRYWIGGQMPNPGGVEQAGSTGSDVPRHESWQILTLIAAAIGAKVGAMLINYVIEDKVESLGGDLDDGKVATWLHWAKWSFGRINFFMLQNLVGWLFLYSLVWILIKWPFLTQPDPDSSVRFRVRVATIMTLICLILLRIVVWFEREETFQREVMISIGVTLGFAWRRCYGITIDAITRTYGDKLVEGSPYSGEVLFELLTALPFVFLLKPMQYWYITPKCMTVKDGGEPVKAGEEAGDEEDEGQQAAPRGETGPQKFE